MNDNVSNFGTELKSDGGVERRTQSRGAPWAAGLVLILLGAAFMLQNFGLFTVPLHNWWALFILIPAAAAFDQAYHTYRQEGNLLTGPARASLIGGVVLTLIAATFLFSLSWSLIFPLLLILAGVSVLLNPKH